MKRTLAILMAISMICTGLVGCSNSDNGGTSKVNKNQSDTTADTTANTKTTTKKTTIKSNNSDTTTAKTTNKSNNNEETDSLKDYVGRWHAEYAEKYDPFVSVEISADGDVTCYSQDGEVLDSGYVDYDEQRALNGNSLIVFSFDNMGDFEADVDNSVMGEMFLNIKFGEEPVTFYLPSSAVLRYDMYINDAIATLYYC